MPEILSQDVSMRSLTETLTPTGSQNLCPLKQNCCCIVYGFY